MRRRKAVGTGESPAGAVPDASPTGTVSAVVSIAAGADSVGIAPAGAAAGVGIGAVVSTGVVSAVVVVGEADAMDDKGAGTAVGTDPVDGKGAAAEAGDGASNPLDTTGDAEDTGAVLGSGAGVGPSVWTAGGAGAINRGAWSETSGRARAFESTMQYSPDAGSFEHSKEIIRAPAPARCAA